MRGWLISRLNVGFLRDALRTAFVRLSGKQVEEYLPAFDPRLPKGSSSYSGHRD